MNYFAITESITSQVVGIFPQSIDANHAISINSPLHLDYAGYDRKINDTVILPEPILRKTAKRTDLVSTVSITNRLVTSDRLKEIMALHFKETIQFLRTNLIFKDQKLPYWIANSIQYDDAFVDYSQSDIWLEGAGGVAVQKEQIHSYDAFLNRKKSLELPLRLTIKKTVLAVKHITKEAFILKWGYGGICYVVSEKVKTEMDNAGCTGVTFEAIPAV
jgi:hypothetical protein